VTDYAAVLTANYPDANWSLNANDYDSLDWHGPGDKPSQADLDAAWPAVQQAEADAREAQEAAKQSAISKLAALGLTVDEISAAFGLGGE
jgi:hypothetical protein